MTAMTEAFAAARAEKKSQPRKDRPPVLVQVGRFAGRYLPTWKRVRTNLLAAAGFGFIDFAAYELHHIAGYAAIGVSLLVVEALGGDK